MKPRVFVTRQLPGNAIETLESSFDVSVWPREDPVPHDMLIASIRGMHGILTTPADTVDQMVLQASMGLRVVANMDSTVDNIDVEGCTDKGILVTNTGRIPAESVADVVFGLMVVISRRLPEAWSLVSRGGWHAWSPSLMLGQDVHGSVLGIVGSDDMAEAVARRAAGFSMKALYWDTEKQARIEQRTSARFSELDDLLRQSDFVVVLSPAIGQRGLIGERELALMKSTAVLVAAGAGGVVDQRALYRALSEGRILGAGLDVYEVEPINILDPVIRLPNVVALPHMGSATVRTRTAMAMSAVENLAAALQGEVPANLVNPEVIDVLKSRPLDIIAPVRDTGRQFRDMR